MSDPVFKIYNSYIVPGSNLSLHIGSNTLEFQDLWCAGIAHIDNLRIEGIFNMGSSNITNANYIYGINTNNYIFFDSAGSTLNFTINATTGLFSLKAGSTLLLSGTNIFINSLSNTYIGLSPNYVIIDTAGSLRAKGYYYNLTTVAGNYTAKINDDVILGNATNGAFVVSLLSANMLAGKIYYIKKIDTSTNVVTIDANSVDLLDNATSLLVNNQYESYTIVCNGTGWFIL